MSEENKVSLDENGDVKVSDELLNKISGGSNPEDSDDEEVTINIYCPKKER